MIWPLLFAKNITYRSGQRRMREFISYMSHCVLIFAGEGVLRTTILAGGPTGAGAWVTGLVFAERVEFYLCPRMPCNAFLWNRMLRPAALAGHWVSCRPWTISSVLFNAGYVESNPPFSIHHGFEKLLHKTTKSIRNNPFQELYFCFAMQRDN